MTEREWKFNQQSMNAMDWVKEFNRIEVSKGLQPTDPEWMLGWFANAIMAGYDEANRRSRREREMLVEVLDNLQATASSVLEYVASYNLKNSIRMDCKNAIKEAKIALAKKGGER